VGGGGGGEAWEGGEGGGGWGGLKRAESLPAVLRCADAAAELPQGAMLAAEAIAFSNFSNALQHPNSTTRQMALRVLVAAARAGRDCVIDPAALVRAGLGDTLTAVASVAEFTGGPWLTAAVIEAERICRRLGHWSHLLSPDVRPLAEQQAMRLWASDGRRAEWLSGAAARLLARFPAAGAAEQ